MIDLPDFLPLRVTHRVEKPAARDLDGLDRLVVLICGKRPATAFRGLPGAAALQRAADRMRRQKRSHTTVTVDNPRGTVISLHSFEGANAFARLTSARKIVAAQLDPAPRHIGAYCVGDGDTGTAIETIVTASAAATFHLPDFKSKASKRPARTRLTIFGGDKPELGRLLAESRANNLARWLTALPPNQLTAPAYIEACKTLAGNAGLKFELLDEKRLDKLGAGAFLAVSQGNATRDAGIVRLRYRPQGSGNPKVALVGKGIVFDTGGSNLKPFKSMLDMHIDMGGSAVALATGLALAELAVPFAFDVWLAITPNRISATAYTSQDIVTAANGTTIQVIHTDAEGRMVLADTLTLASKEEPELILDYATLTGTCIAALTPRYSGVFTNRPKAHATLIDAGATSGERVWSFPLDDDYDDSLKSDVADIKQCSPDGYGDHILAARFLKRFVPDSIPWVHMDLSAAQSRGGLAHVPTEITGFGVRYTIQLLLEQFDGPADFIAAVNLNDR